MSDFFNKLANSAKQAQSDRIIRQSQKKLLPPFATYQGKDPVDGTDRVAIDGVTNSGFKLISNAPVSVGERVYLRPNQQGGLQRADARNRPIAQTPVIEAKSLIKILFLKDEKLYIGGDRLEPELIYEAPSGYVINLDTFDGLGARSKSIILNNYGSGKNDWVCQFFIRTTDSIPLLFSSFDPVLYDSQIFYETFTYTYIVLDSTGVIYSKDFDYAHLQGDQIYLGVGGAQALSRSIAGGYGYVGLTGLMGKLDSAQLEDTSFNPIFDPDNGDPIYGFGQWQTLAINSATDTLVPLQNKNLYAFPFDAVRTDTLDLALFDNPSESRLVFLETISNEYYYGTFGRLLTMGKNQNDCLLFRRSGGDFFADWYTAGNPIPVSIPYTFVELDLEDKYSANHIGNKIYVCNSFGFSSINVITIALNTDATVSITTEIYEHLGFGSFDEFAPVDFSFSPI